MWSEFKKFAFKGNIIDMAVGVVVGGAFSTIVTSLVNDIVMPIFGKLTAGMDFKSLKLVLSAATDTKPEAAIMYGNFIQNIVSFLIIAFSMFFLINSFAKASEKAKKLMRTEEKEPTPEEVAPKAPTEVDILAEIRDLLKSNAADTPANEE
ncbi:MAG: large-conductance mechanosensitive channel protein MscL [Clostridia bacterium]|nr:large-conductance mechanosensitive channel protein MscL [Clostridia bacterium]